MPSRLGAAALVALLICCQAWARFQPKAGDSRLTATGQEKKDRRPNIVLILTGGDQAGIHLTPCSPTRFPPPTLCPCFAFLADDQDAEMGVSRFF